MGRIAALTMGLCLSLSANAAKLASFCSVEANDPQAKITGLKVDERLPIASVSKLITTTWALASKDPDYRFVTKIYISIVEDHPKNGKTADVHFEGSRDPYFGRYSLHYLISELNKLQIFRIRNLTFDQDFKFFWNANGGPMLAQPNMRVESGYYYADSPQPKTVTAELSRYRLNWTYQYSQTRQYMAGFKIDMVAKPKMTVARIQHVPKDEFKVPSNATVRGIRSSGLIMLLKEMNRISNNHAANQIFEHLGGREKFRTFAAGMGFTEKEIYFYNGHGNRHDADGGSFYNEATCSTVLWMMISLRKILQAQGKDLDEVLPVPKVDVNSTLGSYQNTSLGGAIAAKTGTVGPAVTLAGLLLTKKGPVFFMYNISTVGSTYDWKKARSMISQQLTALAKKYSGGMPFDVHSVRFIALDAELLTDSQVKSAFVPPTNDGSVASAFFQD